MVLTNGQRLWVAAERLHEVQCIFPDNSCNPPISLIANELCHSQEDALRELIRSRLEGLVAVTAQQLGAPLGIEISKIELALLALEQQGIVMRGQFTSGATDTEWCERGLLARIHRYTLRQLRNEIEPVSPADFMRFLFQWHRLHDPVTGEAGLERALRQLEGYNMAAISWETEVLAKRVKPYFAHELDRLCTSGKFVWLRLKALNDAAPKSAGKTTPITLLSRENLGYWRQFSPLPDKDKLELSGSAQKVYALIKEWGASFFQELLVESGLLKTHLEAALSELAAAGLLTSDSFQGLRILVLPQKILHRRSKRHPAHDPLAAAGRWSLLRPSSLQADNQYQAAEAIARVLLRRYGIVFRKLLEKEEGLPSWRELLYVYRRLEARGEIRGGRFVQGFAGEQFALPEAVLLLKDIRKQPNTGELTVINAADPLNLTGLITPGERIAAPTRQRIVYRDGVPLAHGTFAKTDFHEEIDTDRKWRLKWALMDN
jgi:ATP-dependent Lhr-like helicase